MVFTHFFKTFIQVFVAHVPWTVPFCQTSDSWIIWSAYGSLTVRDARTFGFVSCLKKKSNNCSFILISEGNVDIFNLNLVLVFVKRVQRRETNSSVHKWEYKCIYGSTRELVLWSYTCKRCLCDISCISKSSSSFSMQYIPIVISTVCCHLLSEMLILLFIEMHFNVTF